MRVKLAGQEAMELRLKIETASISFPAYQLTQFVRNTVKLVADIPS